MAVMRKDDTDRGRQDIAAPNSRSPHRSLVQEAEERAMRQPTAVAIVDGHRQLTYADLLGHARGIVRTLRDAGLAQGDVVSFQLPNWWETAAINLACSIGGWVCNPITPIYREYELEHILRDSRSRALFVPVSWRKTDYVAMISPLRPRLSHLILVITVRGRAKEALSWDEIARHEHPVEPAEPLASEPKLLLYTSGTTGVAKGVLHSHAGIASELGAVCDFWRVTDKDVMLMPSPVTHIAGYLYALEMVFFAGCRIVLMDKWEASDAVDLALTYDVTITCGATPFLIELAAALAQCGIQLPAWRIFACGGASVAPEQIAHASAMLPNALIFRIYGSTETPTVTLGINRVEDRWLGVSTDGRIVNNEVVIWDEQAGQAADDGVEGEIFVKGPEVMMGYTDPQQTAEAFTDDGFFRTGDLGVRRGGTITITGRKKDLIVRGGENISPREVEDLLLRLPEVLEAAVVGMPHPRLAETPCAFLTLKAGTSLTLEQAVAHLRAAGLASQKLPERLDIIEYMPRNASGKILKHELRARLVP